MLPLTEGSLRLRADDEDSLTSDDSFFSATEVTWGGGWTQRDGWIEGQASLYPGVSMVMGKCSHFLRWEQNLAVTECCSPGTPCSCWGWGGLRSQGS